MTNPQDMSAIWRNGITNTIAIVDAVRKKHAPYTRNLKTAQFDHDLNKVISEWFTASRSANPVDYEAAEEFWNEFMKERSL
jgi:hypothetical protein